MKKYYLVDEPYEPKVVGVKDGGGQAEVYKDGYETVAKYNEYDNLILNINSSYWSSIETLINKEIPLECVKTRKGAILTDFLSYYPNLYYGGKFLLSPRALEVVESYNLGNYKSKVVRVVHKGVDYNYHLLYVQPSFAGVDYKKSSFYSGNELLGKKYLDINSLEEFKNMKRKMLFDVEKLYLNNEFDQELDFFIHALTIPDIYISEKLKSDIISNELTGLNILPNFKIEILPRSN